MGTARNAIAQAGHTARRATDIAVCSSQRVLQSRTDLAYELIGAPATAGLTGTPLDLAQALGLRHFLGAYRLKQIQAVGRHTQAASSRRGVMTASSRSHVYSPTRSARSRSCACSSHLKKALCLPRSARPTVHRTRHDSGRKNKDMAAIAEEQQREQQGTNAAFDTSLTKDSLQPQRS
jgi:hypothetical protein